jgi:hypothetical protein
VESTREELLNGIREGPLHARAEKLRDEWLDLVQTIELQRRPKAEDIRRASPQMRRINREYFKIVIDALRVKIDELD